MGIQNIQNLNNKKQKVTVVCKSGRMVELVTDYDMAERSKVAFFEGRNIAFKDSISITLFRNDAIDFIDYKEVDDGNGQNISPKVAGDELHSSRRKRDNKNKSRRT